MQKNIVAEPQLAGQRKQKIEWVKRNMPILREIENDFRKHQYFSGLWVLICIHLEAKTAYLAQVFAAGSEDNGSEDGSGTAAKFNKPLGITSDGTILYVVDSANNKIRKIE